MADIVLILLIGLFALSGYRKGFAKTLISTLANIISLVFSITLTKPVSTLVFNSPVGNIISGIAKKTIESNAGNTQLSQSSIEMMAEGIAMTASSVISFVIIGVVVKIAVVLLAEAIGIVTRLPIIRQANAALGAVVGVLGGVVISYVLIGIIYALGESGAMEYGILVQSLEESLICSKMYYNNIVANAIVSVV